MVRIRQFTLDDYDAALRLWDDPHLGPVPRREVETKLKRDPELFLVAEDGDGLAGVVMGAYDGRRGWIFRLAVDPAHRRGGVGRALVAEVESRLRRLGATKVNLLVMPGNDGGLAFWQSAGYRTFPVVLGTKDLESEGVDADGVHDAAGGAGC